MGVLLAFAEDDGLELVAGEDDGGDLVGGQAVVGGVQGLADADGVPGEVGGAFGHCGVDAFADAAGAADAGFGFDRDAGFESVVELKDLAPDVFVGGGGCVRECEGAAGSWVIDVVACAVLFLAAGDVHGVLLEFGDFCLFNIFYVGNAGDGGEYADDGDDDHEFDEGHAAFEADRHRREFEHGVLLLLGF